ncbi:MAG: zf-HC2 domain-containing protein [Anaeromyxobacter sp.]|nr:zf-HC2 domain-containing protein [Anaeromyxobacter sp.]MBL0275954.1 zf-HC2 domain-containing protein [Anaeromyxobacter sp.]
MTSPRDEQVVAGLSCSEVLALLSDYLDGDLPAAARGQVEAHLRGCEGCTRFGGEFTTTVRALRAHLARATALPGGVRERLRLALDGEAERP